MLFDNEKVGVYKETMLVAVRRQEKSLHYLGTASEQIRDADSALVSDLLL